MAMDPMGHTAQPSELDLPGTEHQQDFQPTVLTANPSQAQIFLLFFKGIYLHVPVYLFRAAWQLHGYSCETDLLPRPAPGLSPGFSGDD